MSKKRKLNLYPPSQTDFLLNDVNDLYSILEDNDANMKAMYSYLQLLEEKIFENRILFNGIYNYMVEKNIISSKKEFNKILNKSKKEFEEKLKAEKLKAEEEEEEMNVDNNGRGELKKEYIDYIMNYMNSGSIN